MISPYLDQSWTSLHLYIQYMENLCPRWPAYIRSQGLSSHASDLVLLVNICDIMAINTNIWSTFLLDGSNIWHIAAMLPTPMFICWYQVLEKQYARLSGNIHNSALFTVLKPFFSTQILSRSFLNVSWAMIKKLLGHMPNSCLQTDMEWKKWCQTNKQIDTLTDRWAETYIT